MSGPTDDRKSAAKRKAEDHFTASARRDLLVKDELEKERSKVTAKMAKLKALRLAKETADAEAAASAPRQAKAAPRVRRRIVP